MEGLVEPSLPGASVALPTLGQLASISSTIGALLVLQLEPLEPHGVI